MTIDEWSDLFAKCVRERDYATARGLVSQHVYSFGTVACVAVGRGDLEFNQWCVVWPSTHGFKWTERMTFELGQRSDDDILLAARWSSYRGEVERRGRATIVLRRTDNGLLEAIHTHFSEDPTSKETT